MENLPFHPHYDVWALIVSLVIFFELSTKDKTIKKDKRKLWYSGLLILWAFTDYPIHDIGERYLFSVHSAEHLVLALVSPPLLLMGMHREMKKLVSVKPLISENSTVISFLSPPKTRDSLDSANLLTITGLKY